MQVSEETQQFLDEGAVAAKAYDGGDWFPHTVRPPQSELLALYDHSRRVFFKGTPSATALGWTHWRRQVGLPQDAQSVGQNAAWIRCDERLPDVLHLEFSRVWVAHKHDNGLWDVDMCDISAGDDDGEPFDGLGNMRLVYGDEHVWWAPITEPKPPKI